MRRLHPGQPNPNPNPNRNPNPTLTLTLTLTRLDRCDALAEIIAERAAPPQLLLRPWDSFSECAKSCEAATIEGMVTHAEIAWKVTL